MRSVASKDVISFIKEHIIHRFGIPQTWRIKTIQWSMSVKSEGAGRRLEMWHIEWLRRCRSSFGGARAEAGHVAKAGGIGGFHPKPPQDLVSQYSQKPRAKASRRRTRGGINAIEILFAHLLSPFLCFVFEVLAFNLSSSHSSCSRADFGDFSNPRPNLLFFLVLSMPKGS